MRAGLVADTYLEGLSVTHFKKKYEYELRGDEEVQIARLAEDGDIYNKALLLLLVGAPDLK